MSLSGLPPSSPMPLQCFPPLYIAKKWLEASSFCTVGCWPAPQAKRQSRRTDRRALIQPGQPKVAAFPPPSPRDKWPVPSCCCGGCDGTLFGHLPGQQRDGGKENCILMSGGFCQWDSSKREKKSSSDERLAAGTVNCSMCPGRFLADV